MDYSRELYKFLHDDVKLSRKKTTIAVQKVTDKVGQIVAHIHSKDKRFQRQVRSAGSYYQGLKVKAADEFDFNIYLDGFDEITQWGFSAPPRYYRFNRDYDREAKITVNMMWEFVMPPPLFLVPGISHTASNVRNPALLPTSPLYNPDYEQPGRSMAAGIPHQRALQAPPSYRQLQGPAQPSHPPVDIDNLDTLPDNMEIIPTSAPLPEPPTGYMHFSIVPHSWGTAQDFVYDGDIIPFYVQRKFKKLLQESLRELPDFRGNISLARKVHGPALTLKIPTDEKTLPEISVDFAVTIPTKLPKPSFVNWPRAGKRWPSSAKADAVQRAGINFVAKKPYYWLVSYGAWEKELIKGINPNGDECRKDCHRIMKRVRERFWCKTSKPVISSYHLKNILFWECEDHPLASDWKRDMIWQRFDSMTRRLLEAIRTKRLLHYFDTRINLLENKDAATLGQERTNIENFMGDPLKYLARVQQDA